MSEINLNTRQKKVVQARDSKILCLASAASGKALPNSTRIPTTEGWKEVGDIKPGDYLFDRHGRPTKVLQIFPQGELEVFQLIFGDGRTALCSKDHIWSVNKTTWKNKNSFREYTCEELLKEELIDSNRRAKFYIPCSSAIELPEQEYKISPYIIGAFLGDGCCTEHQLTFSSEDEEIVNKIATLLGNDVVSFKRHESNYSWGFYHLDKSRTKIYTSILPKELINYSYDKSIPNEYKRGSIEQRLELLQGLFDTDGSITKDKRGDHAATATVRFTSTSLNLTEDVKEVLGSLGYISTISTDERKDKYTTGICYNLSVNMPNSDKYKLFSLQRKRDIALSVKDKKQQKKYDRTSIREIKDLGYKEEMTCFLVDNEEHLFLMNDCIVTHNTRTLTERIRYIIQSNKGKPEDMVAICFTNQAASEMYSRLGKLGEKMFIGTIHSYANKLCTFNGLDTEQYIREEKFDKIIERAMTIPRDKLKPISYLFIDECQDLGDLEFNFLTYLKKDNEFWCGDEKQAIYGFKGATDKYLREMYEDPTYAKYFLVENYRNTPEIIDFAEGFLNGVESLSPKSIPRKTKNGFIERCRFPEALEELEASGNWGSWFIIARTNRDVYSIMEILKEKEIPNTTFKRSELSIEEMENLMAENTVKVMTCHAAKGLESPNVIVVGALTYNKEERRIAYVAATRAETNLWWCPALKKEEGKLKEPNQSFKTNRQIQRAYGELIEF